MRPLHAIGVLATHRPKPFSDQRGYCTPNGGVSLLPVCSVQLQAYSVSYAIGPDDTLLDVVSDPQLSCRRPFASSLDDLSRASTDIILDSISEARVLILASTPDLTPAVYARLSVSFLSIARAFILHALFLLHFPLDPGGIWPTFCHPPSVLVHISTNRCAH
jgi:hypothetical protein